MKKRFTILMLILLIFGSVSFVQATPQATASLAPPVTASPGDPVVIPLMVTNFDNIGAITFTIQFKANTLSFNTATLISNPVTTGFMADYINDSTFVIVWTYAPGGLPNPINITSGLLMDLNFIYTGPGTSPLNFITASCEVATAAIPPVVIPVTYTNGGVSADLNNIAKATLISTTATTGSNIQVVIKYENFFTDTIPPAHSNPIQVGAITQKVQYDPAKLSFVGVTGEGNLNSGFNASAANGVVSIAWSDAAGKNINFDPSALHPNRFIITFNYVGNSGTTVDFHPGCIISTNTGANIKVSYIPVTIAMGPAQATATLGTKTGALQGDIFNIPVTLNGFDVLGTAAITLNINFDSPRLTYIGLADNPHGATVNITGSTISIAWFDATPHPPLIIDGDFLKLKFKYNGVGTANITFGAGCLFSKLDGTTIQVAYTNGTVTPGTAPYNANIGKVQGYVGQTVLVPVTFDAFPVPPNGMGAVTMSVKFDTTIMMFMEIPTANNPHGATWQRVKNAINIAWNSTAGPGGDDINAPPPFVQLEFTYYGGGGGCGTDVTFGDNPQVADGSGTPVAVNWYNGWVKEKRTISGHLYYNNTTLSNLPLPSVTIYVKDGPEPIPPNVTPVPNIIASTTTDVNGYYSVDVYNGSYYLYASNTAAWAGVGQPDVTNLRRYVANLTPNTIFGNPLRVRAADINQDGTVDNSDVTPLRRRIANLIPTYYMAPDWLFQNPIVLINCANLPGTDFLGICSGDVNGSYPDANAK
jgi:hypothetical protein